MRITATQISMLKEIVAGGGIATKPSPSASGTYRKLKHLENLGLLSNRDHLLWEITPKGLNVSRLNINSLPAHEVSPPILEDDGGILVDGQHVSPGDEILVKGRRGKFKLKCASTTSTGRVVISTVGPVGMHQAFRDFYLEDVKLVPVAKPKRRRRAK